MGALNASFRAAYSVIIGLALLAASSPLAFAGASQLVSVRDPANALAVPGNGGSAGPILTPDGRYLVFVSTANDLTPGGNNQFAANVYLRDRQFNTTTLVSTNINGTGGGNSGSVADAISTDGRYILFESDATDLLSGVTNGLTQLFMRDMIGATTSLVSVSANGSAANGPSLKAAMTPDGRFVAFISYASNLVANDTNGISDVFVRDTLAGTTMLASPGATIVTNGVTNVMDTPVITPDGRYVAFFSYAKNLVGSMTSWPGDIFLSDLQTATMTWVSSTNHSNPRLSTHPALSDDGRYVAFKQETLVNTPNSSVYRFDAVAGVTILINTNSAGVSQTNGMTPAYVDDVLGPEITPDGRYVFYVGSSNTAPATIYEWDGQTGSNSPVSLNTSGVISSNAISHSPVVTGDAHYLAFLSSGTNMVANTVSNGFHLYLRDLQLGTNYLVDVDSNGVGSIDMTGAYPSLSSNGQFIAFSSLDAAFVIGDNNLALDVFVRDVTSGTNELISAHNSSVVPQSGAGISYMSQTSITPDGRWLVFSSRSDDLVTNDSNNDQDVFVRDLLVGTNALVSVTTNGTSPLGGYSGSPSITPDGRYVVFVSAATNLYNGDTNRAADIFIRDLQSGTTTVAFANSIGGAAGSGDASAPVMSSDGRYIAFLCRSNSSTTTTFWRDVVSNQTVMLTNVSTPVPPSMSTNGRYVAFSDNNLHFYVRDMQTSANVYANFGQATSMALSGDGTKLLYANGGQVVVADITTGTNIFVFAASLPAPIRSAAQWSADGRYMAFVTKTAVGAGDVNLSNDVLLCDLQTKTLTLVSLNSSHTGSANAASDAPAVSGDGRFVVYRSFASNIVPAITNVPNLFVFDRLTSSNTLLTVDAAPASTWSTFVSQPAISSDGSAVAFQSLRPNLVSGLLDLNRSQDIFSQPQSPLSFADSDGDGIPDWWTMQYFGHPTGQAGDLSRAQDDADGDGMSNLQEYLTGTDPKNVGSVFQMQMTPVIAATTNVTLTWPSVPGKSYSVLYKNQLTDPQWNDLGSTIYVGSSQVSLTVPANVTSRYYRVLAVN